MDKFGFPSLFIFFVKVNIKFVNLLLVFSLGMYLSGGLCETVDFINQYIPPRSYFRINPNIVVCTPNKRLVKLW